MQKICSGKFSDRRLIILDTPFSNKTKLYLMERGKIQSSMEFQGGRIREKNKQEYLRWNQWNEHQAFGI